ncbi:hypothetical protein C8F01DRAFT_1271269 [Mycena amicta]|nr:hypothetical protein C8F01DRAFT_1271269 [Mycena amicta]
MSGEPYLPPELERTIFLAVTLAAPSEARTLMLVAWRVKEWVEPLLCRTLIITMHRHISLHNVSSTIPKLTPRSFYELVERRRKVNPLSSSESFFTNSVENLVLVALWPDDIRRILTICCRTKELLALGGAGTLLRVRGTLEPLMGLRRLQCNLNKYFDLPASASLDSQPVLAHLTHLHMLDRGEHTGAENTLVWSHILALPALTHLACSSTHWEALLPVKCDMVIAALQPSGALCAFLLVEHADLEEFDADHDPRLKTNPGFVYLPEGLGGWAAEWSDGVLTGNDLWARADELILKRWTGEVGRDEYKLLPVQR